MADFMETRSVYNLPSYEDAVPSLAPPLHGDESPPSVSTSSSDNIPFPVDATINRKLCWFEGAGHHVEADVLLIGKSEIVICVGNNGRARRGTTCFPFTSSNQAVTSFLLLGNLSQVQMNTPTSEGTSRARFGSFLENHPIKKVPGRPRRSGRGKYLQWSVAPSLARR